MSYLITYQVIESIIVLNFSFIIFVSLCSLVEGSFRSIEAHTASFEQAKNHPGYGSAVLVISQIEDAFSVSNGVYVASGKVLTHSHEVRIPEKTWVASPFSGFKKLPQDISLNIVNNGFSYVVQTATNTKFADHKACKKVQSISFPTTRQEVTRALSLREYNVEDLSFVQNTHDFLVQAAEYPVGILGKKDGALAGDDYCILNIEPFADHPIAKLASRVEEGRITVIGHSLKTHISDGTDCFFWNTIDDVVEQLKQAGETSATMTMPWIVQMTTFSQEVQKINNKLIVQAISAKQKTARQIFQKETWDKDRTPATIEALIVDGLSGSGVYNQDGELVGIVSCAFQNAETIYFHGIEEIFEERLIKELKKAKDALSVEEKEAAKAEARKTAAILRMPHPLLNIHQGITSEVFYLLS